MDGTGSDKDAGAVQPGAADGGAGASAGGAGGEGQPGAATGGAVDFDRGKLHPVLRDMSPEQITDLFETMATGLRATTTPPPAQPGWDSQWNRPGVPAHVPPEPKKEEIDYKTLLDPGSDKFNPEAAFSAFVQKNYGKLVGDINRRSISGLMQGLRNELPDFREYEQDITTALSNRDPATLTEQDVLGSYFAAKGMRATMKERADRAAKTTTTLPPTPKGPDDKKIPELNDIQKQVARKMFRNAKNAEEAEKQYTEFMLKDDEGPITMTVPIGGGKRG